MHTIELFEQVLATANQLDYQIRYENLGGSGGGGCEFGGKKWLFVDLALSTIEQLEQVVEALRDDPAIREADVPPKIRETLGLSKAA